MPRRKDGPRVFGDSDLTLAIDQDGLFKVFVGQRPIGLVQRLRIEATGDERPVVEITLPSSTGSEESDLQVEEYSRALRAYPWIRVLSR